MDIPQKPKELADQIQPATTPNMTAMKVKVEDDKTISALASKLGTSKTDALHRALEVLSTKGVSTETPHYDGMIRNVAQLPVTEGSGAAKTKDSLMEVLMTKMVIEQMKPPATDNIDFNKIMAVKMLTPQTDPTMMMMLMQNANNKGGNSDQIMQLMVQQQTQQAQQYQQMMLLLMGKQADEQTSKLVGQMDAQGQTMQGALNQLAQSLTNFDARMRTMESKPPSTMQDEIQKSLAIEHSLMEFAKSRGLKPETITSTDGKIDWGGLLKTVVNTGGEILKSVAQNMPQQAPPPLMPVTPVQQAMPIAPPMGSYTPPPADVPQVVQPTVPPVVEAVPELTTGGSIDASIGTSTSELARTPPTE